MHKYSEDAAKITDQLFWLCPENVWFGRAKKNQQVQVLLNQIAAFDHPAALPVIVRFLLSKEPATRSLASKAIAEISSRLSVKEILHLNELILSKQNWHVVQEWWKVKPSQVSAYAGSAFAEHRAYVLGLLSIHANGYVRHEAVRQLSLLEDGEEVPYLLIRQNDWVQSIANDAKHAVANRLNESYLPHFAKYLDLVLRLNRSTRLDNSETVDRILALLFSEGQRQVLKSAVATIERETLRAIIAKGLDIPGDHHSFLIKLGLASPDPVARLQSCRKLLDVYGTAEIEPVLVKLRSDRFIPVRREALLVSAKIFPDHARQLFQEGLFDPSRAIRELCRFHLTKLGTTDFASIYRVALIENDDLLPAMIGLAETADGTDMEYFKHLSRHPLATRRSAAVQGLGRSLDGQPFPDCLRLLNDPGPRVVREVRKSLKEQVLLLSLDELFAVALGGERDFNRKNAVVLIAERGKWASLPWLIRIATEADEETAGVALEEIRFHLRANKVFTKPTHEQNQQIVSALNDAGSHLSLEVVSLIESDLRCFANRTP
jgi:HEAT repeat protein